MNDEQRAVQEAIIRGEMDNLKTGLTSDERAIAVKAGDVSAVFAPFEIAEMNENIGEEDELTEPQEDTIVSLWALQRLCAGEITREEAKTIIPVETGADG